MSAYVYLNGQTERKKVQKSLDPARKEPGILAMRGALLATVVGIHALSAAGFRPLNPEYLRDPLNHANPSELPAQGWISAGDMAHGYDTATWWIRFRLNGPESREPLYVEHSYASTDKISLFLQGDRQPRSEAGDRIPHRLWPYSYHHPILPVPDLPGDGYVYLRIQTSSSVVLAAEVVDHQTLIRRIDEQKFALGLFYGLILALAAYNFFLFITTRQLVYALYVLFILTFNLFQANINGILFQYLWPDALWWTNQSLPFFICLGSLAGIAFSRYFLRSTTVIDRAYRILAVYGLITSVLSLIIPYTLGIRMAILMSLSTSVALLTHGVLSLRAGIRSARFYLTAWTLMLFGIIMYALKSLGMLPTNGFTTWSMQIGSAAEAILLSLGLADKINDLSTALQTKVAELEASRKETEEAASLLRELFDANEDMIFLTDRDMKILSSNKAVKRHLGYSPDETLGRDILSLIRSSEDQLAGLLLLEKLEEVVSSGKVVRVRAPMKQKNFGEPKDMDMTIQYLSIGDLPRILITARPLAENLLHAAIRRERTHYEIGNSLQYADLLSSRLIAALPELVSDEEKLHIRLGLREMLINAIEHGNLGITFPEKSRELDDGTYLNFLQARQKDPARKARKVRVDYVLRPNLVAYRISDEGDGFDHKAISQIDLQQLSESGEAHGRGVAMTRSVFDKVSYNTKGNQVTLIKFFRQKLSAAK